MNDLTLTMSLNFICRAIIVQRAEELLTPRRGRASRHSGDVAKKGQWSLAVFLTCTVLLVAMPEWSKGFDSSSNVFGRVGSNPTRDKLLRSFTAAVNVLPFMQARFP